MRRIVAALAIVGLAAMAGCVGELGGDPAADTQSAPSEDAKEFLEDANLDTSDKWSHTLENGTYKVSEPKQVFVPSPAPYEDEVSIGIVKPKDLGPNETVPVVADVGPYYGELEGPVTNPDDARLDNFLIENLVPHGYAVAMVSVPGTGDSGGCEDYFGPREQAAVDAAVKALAEKDWSSGKVGLIGKSYDGSTPWEAASTPAANEHLETIVPLAGIPSFHDLHFMNGTAESRTAFLNLAYWSFGVAKGGAFGPLYYGPAESVEQPSPAWADRACPAVAEHVANGASGTATGGADASGYWETRSFKEEVQENYDGSVFIVHGLQDWNVHPDVVTEIWSDLDVKKKLWFGQWSHIYPDRPEEVEDCDLCPHPDGVRWDFAEVLKRWFDAELKGQDVDTGPKVWSQDNRGGWHASEDWPPQEGTEAHDLYLGDGTLARDETGSGSATLLAPARASGEESVGTITWTSEPFEDRTRITGEPKLHFDVTPTASEGNLRADLYDVGPDDERKWVGHAYMNIKYHAGGDEMQQVVPGEEIEVKMQLFPLDVVVPEDHKLELTLEQFGPVPKPTGPMQVHWGEGYGSGLAFEDVHGYETGLPWRSDGAGS
jgi:predicted acyl esterase